jgi:hypothetical protein
MFLGEQAMLAPKGRAAVDQRARALASISDKLRLIKDEFQFNLLVRKAVDLVGFTEREEAVLRREARRGARGATQQSVRSAISSPPDTANARVGVPDALAQAELGLVALALHYAELRPQLKLRLSALPNSAIGALLEEICAAGESIDSAAFEVAIMSRLDEQRRGWLSATMVGPSMDDPARAPSLMDDYLGALAEDRRRREVAQLRHTALTASGDEAAAAAQALIVARRRVTP